MNNLSDEELAKFFAKNYSHFSFCPKQVPEIPYSVVLSTRNRAPQNFQRTLLNPLYWSVHSIIEQSIKPSEIILINDQSDPPPADYTGDTVSLLKNECEKQGITLIYHKNKMRLNAALSRNLGADLARHSIIWFIDDDCVFRPDSCLGIWLFQLIQEFDSRCFILNLPQYVRASYPTRKVIIADIGKIDRNKLEVTSNLTNQYPNEYVVDPVTVKIKGEILLKPLMLENYQGGHVVIDKAKLKDAGGFPDYGSPIAYGEETGLAIRGAKLGYRLYYLPYINLSAVHMVYGNPEGRQKLIGEDWLSSNQITLQEMVQESIKERLSSGMRVSREMYFYIKIRNFALLLEEIEQGMGFVDWANKSYYDFVEADKDSFMDNKGRIGSIEIRRKIWQLGISDARAKSCLGQKELLAHLS